MGRIRFGRCHIAQPYREIPAFSRGQGNDISLGRFGIEAFGFAGGWQGKGRDLLILIGQYPANRFRKVIGVVSNVEAIALDAAHQIGGVALRIGFGVANVKHLFGVIAMRFVEGFHRRRILRQRIKKRIVIRVARHMGRDFGANDGVLWGETGGLDDLCAITEREIDVAHIHQVHCRTRQVFDIHLNIEKRRIRAQNHTGPRYVMRPETHDIFAGTTDCHKGTLVIMAKFNGGTIHFGTGHFTMQRMSIGRAWAAIGQQPGMERKTAIGFDNDVGRSRHAEHVFHGQIHTIKHRIPDHLPHEGQNHQIAAFIFQPDCFDAGFIAKQAGRHAAMRCDDMFGFTEEGFAQVNLG